MVRYAYVRYAARTIQYTCAPTRTFASECAGAVVFAMEGWERLVQLARGAWSGLVWPGCCTIRYTGDGFRWTCVCACMLWAYYMVCRHGKYMHVVDRKSSGWMASHSQMDARQMDRWPSTTIPLRCGAVRCGAVRHDTDGTVRSVRTCGSVRFAPVCIRSSALHCATPRSPMLAGERWLSRPSDRFSMVLVLILVVSLDTTTRCSRSWPREASFDDRRLTRIVLCTIGCPYRGWRGAV